MSNALAEHLEWTARKDAPDDGIDLNVEIPAQVDRPSERFLVQVKSANAAKESKLGSWSTSIKRTALAKYKKSRHAVFLFMVDLRAEEIRWLSLSEVLRVHPERRTFALSQAQIFDKSTAQKFADAVRLAMQVQEDLHHPPREALAFRAREFEAQDPRFSVSGEIVGGVEKYTFAPKPGTAVKMTISPKTKADARRMRAAVEFGSKADVHVTSIKFDSPSMFAAHEGEASLLKIEPSAQQLRIVVTSAPNDSLPSPGIELSAEMSLGVRGFELRSMDPLSPFQFTFRADKSKIRTTFTVAIVYEPWNGRTLANLPLLDRVLALMRRLHEGGRFIFEVSDYGERREMLSAHLSGNRRAGHQRVLDQLQFCSRLSLLCRRIASTAVFNASETPSDSQLRRLGMAFALIENGSVDCKLSACTVAPSPEGLAALRARSSGSLLLRMPMNLSFGVTTIGALPVQASITDYDISEKEDGSITVKPLSSVVLSLDINPESSL